ncbi:HECT-like Ubiquitin-conjugating enzyme (E2)-binding [Fragilaria crotonensis]|nr:HECT-like Ubiquitin-conjugating enzyme (E2)-binding [Fragilaria crotonensis]
MSNQMSCHYHKCPQQQSKLQSPSPDGSARFRCSQCKQATYCSKACQKGHWKKHRKACQAWSELNRHVQSLPLEEVHRRFQQTQHTIQELEAHQSAILDKTETETLNGIQNGIQFETSRDPVAPVQPPPTLQERSTEATRPKPLLGITIRPAWNATIEAMTHLSSFQIKLKPLAMDLITHNVPDVAITFEPSHDDGNHKSILFSVGDIMSWILPVQIQEYTYSRLSDCLSIRLKCRTTAESTEDDFMTAVPPVTSRIHQLHCKSCRVALLARPIDRIVPLPSGYWDEISDYLICYPGQPAVHFGSTTNTVPIDMIWEDPSVWVVHPDLVADTIQPLSGVDLYATRQSQSLRSTRTTRRLRKSSSNSWKPQQQKQQPKDEDIDVFVIEQLCCSYCCYPLGLATLEGYYLYQHRLVLILEQNQGLEQAQVSPQSPSNQDSDHEGLTSSMTNRGSVAIFIAQELKRYAESQAIFTFIVTDDTAVHNRKTKSCLLLHVVSWDSILVHASASTNEIVPKRVVKVIYKVSSEVPSSDDDDDDDDEEDQDISTWTWGGLDLCCDPIVTTSAANRLPLDETLTAEAATTTISQKKLNSVHLTLDPDEWDELVESVTQCPYFFPKDVIDATIGVKLGMDEIGSNASMAAMDLY